MVVTSPYGRIAVPDVLLPDMVLQRAGELGDKPALIDGPSGRTLSYAQLARGVRALAAGFQRRGLGRGDVVALYIPNLPEYALVFHAVAAAGGVSTTINPLYTADELAYQLRDSKAKFLVTVAPFLDKATDAAGRSGGAEVFVVGHAEGATSLEEVMADPTGLRPPGVSPDDLVALPYSSGTTGLPKGVMLTHRNIVANILQAESTQDVSEQDVLVGVLPFFHIYGLTVIMNIALHLGCTVVTMPRFDFEQFLELVQRHRVTRAHLVPPIVLALAKHPAVDRYDLSSLKLVMSGAAPLGADLAEAAARRVGCHVIQGYGLTETSPVTHVVPEEPERNKPGSIGLPVPETECRIVDLATGRDARAGEVGELWVRGPQIMKGYLNNEEATRAAIDAEGWLHTGDVGYYDEDGYFYLVDRVKELIKYKGMQVAPAELEAVILTHPAVADAAVVGVPDEEAGEVPKAYVVPAGELDPEQLKAFVAERVAPHKRIRAVEVVGEIPKSPSGKILRRMLRQPDAQTARGEPGLGMHPGARDGGFDGRALRALFPALQRLVHLDGAAAPPACRPVADAVRAAVDAWEAGRVSWETWEGDAEATRRLYASLIGTEEARCVTLVGSLSEAAATVAASLPRGRVVVGEWEFRSNLWPWVALRARGFEVVCVPPGPDGAVAGEALAQAVDSSTVLVAVSTVQSASGYRCDLAPVAQRARECGARLFLNATQHLGVLRLAVSDLDPDYVAAHGYKWMLCPRGAAWLYVRPDRVAELRPLAPNWRNAPDPRSDYYGADLELAPGASRADSSLAWLSWPGARAALELLLGLDRAGLEAHCLRLAGFLREGAAARGWEPAPSALPSHIVALRAPDPQGAVARLRAAGVVASVRGPYLRLGFHGFNDDSDVEAALAALGRAPA